MKRKETIRHRYRKDLPNLSKMLKSVQDVLNFGRSGAGAPVKDSSGKVKAVVVGNPEIRFQENEGVQKSIQNAIRYHADKDFKSQYHADLGEC